MQVRFLPGAQFKKCAYFYKPVLNGINKIYGAKLRSIGAILCPKCLVDCFIGLMVNPLEGCGAVESGPRQQQGLVCGVAVSQHCGLAGNYLHFRFQQKEKLKTTRLRAGKRRGGRVVECDSLENCCS